MNEKNIRVWLLSLALGLCLASTVESAPFMKLFMPGDVISGHKKYEEKCGLCHKNFRKALQRPLCMDCHKRIASDVGKKAGFHGLNKKAMNEDCSYCHTEHEGRDFNIVIIDRDMFDHEFTDFPLKGSHKVLVCKVCHSEGKKYRDADSKCIGCHKKNDFHDGYLGEKCADCHRITAWRDSKFDHNRTRFSLKGKHKKVTCSKCHPGKDYRKSPRKCFGCHKVNDIHGGKYSSKCEKCHTPANWKKSLFNHKRVKTVGNVKISDCYACHKGNDIHKGRFDTDCKKCHKAEKWKPSVFDHAKTGFRLQGRHVKTECEVCHQTTGKYEKLNTGCFGCHKRRDKHNGIYGIKCVACHTPDAWGSSVFDHAKTRFKLDGKHSKVSCGMCHKEPIYKGKNRRCVDCHRFDDPHGDRYGTLCASCHKTEEWKKSIFDHRSTILKLNIEKRYKKCALCYKERLGKACFGCHKQDDIHKGKEGEMCERCHFAVDWNKKVFFDHDTTSFPLIGMHAMVPCEECHLDPTYRGVKADCSSCHKEDDKHEGRLGSKCENCHNPNGFNLWLFSHKTRTKFPLDGAHRGLECVSCHNEPVKKKFKISKRCASCHESESVHSGRYWKNCGKCHTTSSFEEIVIKR